jgi:hypothetical protein
MKIYIGWQLPTFWCASTEGSLNLAESGHEITVCSSPEFVKLGVASWTFPVTAFLTFCHSKAQAHSFFGRVFKSPWWIRSWPEVNNQQHYDPHCGNTTNLNLFIRARAIFVFPLEELRGKIPIGDLYYPLCKLLKSKVHNMAQCQTRGCLTGQWSFTTYVFTTAPFSTSPILPYIRGFDFVRGADKPSNANTKDNHWQFCSIHSISMVFLTK